MTIQRFLVLSAVVLVASMTAVYAGPCSQAIDRMQVRVDAKVEAAARTGPSAPESSGALLHRQPTPGSIAAAESRLGEVSPAMVATLAAAMARAREADLAGDQSACEQALADVQRAIGP
jgi:type II secretory pathway component HofQ